MRSSNFFACPACAGSEFNRWRIKPSYVWLRHELAAAVITNQMMEADDRLPNINKSQ